MSTMQRSRPPIMTLTERAALRVREIIADSGKDVAGLRVGVKNSGCAGMAYTVSYVHDVEPADEVVEHGGAKVFVEPDAVLFLLGTEMDYEISKLKSGFVFNNPNETSACGCGESVELQPANTKDR